MRRPAHSLAAAQIIRRLGMLLHGTWWRMNMGTLLGPRIPYEGIRARGPLQALQRVPGWLVQVQALLAGEPSAAGRPWRPARAQCHCTLARG